MALHKLRNLEKCEKELNKKQIMINQLRGKIQNLEQEAYHSSKVLHLKRMQIEQEKTDLIYKQNQRQRSISKTAHSQTRLQHQLDTKQSVIETEREAKKALLKEKERLEKEIKQIKRDKDKSFPSVSISDLSEQRLHRNYSAKNDESMSLYFAKSQVSPRFEPEPKQKHFLKQNSHS